MKSTEPTQPSVCAPGEPGEPGEPFDTACTHPGDATEPFHPGDDQTELSTNEDVDGDDRDDALIRAVAHAPPRRPRSAMAPGARWGEAGRYTIERRLGRGGMGTVYAATDNVLKRVVALKILDAVDANQHAAHYAQLLREAQLAALVEHERIARVYDVGQHDGFAFVAMEYVPGGTLRQRMTGREVPLPQILDIATQIAEGLAELHSKGVIHRDLKPENVMLTAQGGIKLLDFGLARYTVVAPDASGSPARVANLDGVSVAAASGTPGYMAPEQFASEPIDCRVDIFALGVILYELIARNRLFYGATIKAVMAATLEGAPALSDGPWAAIPRRLRDDVAKMLAVDPAMRFADGSRVLTELRTVALELSSSRSELPEATAASVVPLPPGPVRAGFRISGKVAARASVAVAAGLLVALVALRRSHDTTALPPPPAGMTRITAGKLDVGRSQDEIDRECREIGAGCKKEAMEREVPRVTVTVPPFFLDQREVTNEEFAKLLNASRGLLTVRDDDDYHYPRFVRFNDGMGKDEVLISVNEKLAGIEYVGEDRQREFRARPGREKLPAALASWHGARWYCEAQGKRLPSEDEWEAAARGRQDRRFPWGAALPRCGDVAIPNDRAVPMSGDCPVVDTIAVRPVGSADQDLTPDGIRDLAGNVSEWTASRFVPGRRTGDAGADAPGGEAPRVIRGGSFGGSLRARTSGRAGLPPSIMGHNVGFRCALNAKDSSPQT